MKILFGVQGTGNGHISRSRSLAHALRAQGVSVDYLLSGRPAEAYFDMQAFGDYRARPGLSFATRNGAISLWQTLRQSRPLTLWQDIRQLDLTGYQLVLSDFEPITAWAARRQGLDSLGISHQAAFSWPIPRRFDDISARLIMRHYAPVSRAIGLHWFHFGHPILPPIVDTLMPAPSRGEILVYLPFESLSAITALLGRFVGVAFVCYHPQVSESYQQGNLQFHPLSRSAFTASLASCEGVISNAGFELASEALTLGKKLLVKPLSGQFEQASNAMTLEMLGLGAVMASLDPGAVRQWLDHPGIGLIRYPDVATALAAWLADGAREPVTELANRLWRQVCLPEPVCERLAELGFSDSLYCDLLLQQGSFARL